MCWWVRLPAGDTVAAWGGPGCDDAISRPERAKYKRASGNEAVVSLSQAILLPSIYISESLAHQRGIYSPSVLLSQSGGKCNLTPLCLHVSGGQRSAGWNTWEKHCSKQGCSADIKPSLLLYRASFQFCWGRREASLTVYLVQTKWHQLGEVCPSVALPGVSWSCEETLKFPEENMIFSRTLNAHRKWAGCLFLIPLMSNTVFAHSS